MAKRQAKKSKEAPVKNAGALPVKEESGLEQQSDVGALIEVSEIIELPASLVKTKYEENANTNAFTDAEKTKLAGLNNLSNTDDLSEGSTNLYFTQTRVANTPEVAANTAKVSAAGSINTHSDVDTVTNAPTDGQTLVWSAANGRWEPGTIAGGGGGGSHFSLSSGTVAISGEYVGATAPTAFTNPSAGVYLLVIPAGTRIIWLNVFGNNTTLDGSNQFLIQLDHSADSIDRRYKSAQYLRSTGAEANVFQIGTNPTISITSNVTQLLFPSMNGYGSNGFDIVLS